MSKIHGTILSVRKFNGWFYLKIKEPFFQPIFLEYYSVNIFIFETSIFKPCFFYLFYQKEKLSVNEVLICQVLSAANLITSEVPRSDQMLKLTERFILEFFVSHEAP